MLGPFHKRLGIWLLRSLGNQASGLRLSLTSIQAFQKQQRWKSLEYSKASRPNISRAAFRGGTGSSHKFTFGSMVGAMCFPASAFQVKALARLMLWDKSRMRLPEDWTCRSGSASCSLSVKVLYHELLETLGCAPWPHLTRKDSAIFMWWSAHSVVEGFSCWLSSSRRCIRWVKSASTAGSSSAKRTSEAQGPCLTHPDKRPPNAEKMESTLLSWKDSKGSASTRTKKTYKRRRRAGKPNSLLSVRTGWPSYPWAAIWLHEEHIHVGLTASFSSTCEGKHFGTASANPNASRFQFLSFICKLETYFRLYSLKPLLHSIWHRD